MKALGRLVASLTAEVRYASTHPAEVRISHSDGTVDVEIVSGPFRGATMQGIRPYAGLPAMQISAKRGALCLVGFADGNPMKPYVSAWQTEGIAHVRYDGGTRPVARVGDTVDVMLPPVVSVTGFVVSIPRLASGHRDVSFASSFETRSSEWRREMEWGQLACGEAVPRGSVW